MSTKLQFSSGIEKFAQAAAVLLKFEESREMDRVRLLKLLYIADRESIAQTGEPILGTKLVAMKWGPLHSKVLDLINGVGAPEEEAVWSSYFENENYKVKLECDPGNDELSPFEINLLNEISQKYAFVDDWDLVEATHKFQEYEKNYADESSSPIPYEDIFRAVGRDDWIDEASKEARAQEVFNEFFDK